MEMEFYRCAKCGQIIEVVKGTGVPVFCCGEAMQKLDPGTSDGAAEKHVPVISVEGNTVTVAVGSVDHPMMDTHYIEWVALQTKEGFQRKPLQPGQAPKAVFALTEGDSVEAAYAYCNLHGLWKAE